MRLNYGMFLSSSHNIYIHIIHLESIYFYTVQTIFATCHYTLYRRILCPCSSSHLIPLALVLSKQPQLLRLTASKATKNKSFRRWRFHSIFSTFTLEFLLVVVVVVAVLSYTTIICPAISLHSSLMAFFILCYISAHIISKCMGVRVCVQMCRRMT